MRVYQCHTPQTPRQPTHNCTSPTALSYSSVAYPHLGTEELEHDLESLARAACPYSRTRTPRHRPRRKELERGRRLWSERGMVEEAVALTRCEEPVESRALVITVTLQGYHAAMSSDSSDIERRGRGRGRGRGRVDCREVVFYSTNHIGLFKRAAPRGSSDWGGRMEYK